MTRVHGKLIRVTLGKYPALSLAAAREEARNVINLAAVGTDPRRAREQEKREREQERRSTFSACADDFIRLHAERRLRASTQRDYRRVLTGPETREWRGRPISEITKRDVLDVIEAIDARGSPGASKRTLVYLRKFFNWCAERDIIATVPTDRIRATHPEVKRDRVLSEEELRYLLRALNADDSIFAPMVRLLLLTGQRRAEVAGMAWSELRNLDSDQALWEIPAARTKNKRGHLVPLAHPVRDLILAEPRTGDLVFSTTGRTPPSGFGKAKARLDERIDKMRESDGLAPMPPWTLHDLRRTMVTMMNERLGIAPHVVEAVVNHVSGLAKAGVAGVYNRALYLEDRRRALSAWSDCVAALERQR
jgi:integrase